MEALVIKSFSVVGKLTNNVVSLINLSPKSKLYSNGESVTAYNKENRKVCTFDVIWLQLNNIKKIVN